MIYVNDPYPYWLDLRHSYSLKNRHDLLRQTRFDAPGCATIPNWFSPSFGLYNCNNYRWMMLIQMVDLHYLFKKLNEKKEIETCIRRKTNKQTCQHQSIISFHFIHTNSFCVHSSWFHPSTHAHTHSHTHTEIATKQITLEP